MNNTFESQLSASARRLRKQSESNLFTPETMAIPKKNAYYWGWIATPAAAVAGILIGLFIQRPTESVTNFTVPVVASDYSGHSIAEDETDYSLLINL